MAKKLKVVPTRREVIENCLLASITEGGKVALALSQEDLDLLIEALSRAPLTLEQRELLKDMKTLREEAFGDG